MSKANNYAHITCEDFDADVWDALCSARMLYLSGMNRRAWYVALREYAGYQGDNAMMGHMARVIDTWLQEHPSWTGRYYRASLKLKPTPVDTREVIGIDANCYPIRREQ